ncbi:MAG: xanthan lyase [Muribaculaceae bacterium]|nr:xanthan lyase [Muribaculaceae bacterium]
MNLKRFSLCCGALVCSLIVFAENASVEAQVLDVINSHREANFSAGVIKIEGVEINDKKKSVEVKCNSALWERHFTQEQANAMLADVKKTLPAKCEKYKLKITAGGIDINELVLFADRKVVGPKEKTRFITPVNGVAAPAGLDGNVIAMWQSHGWYFEPKLNRWEWQRARIFQTVEDLYTQSYVMPFLMPMLQNAGAYVMSPRDRDTSTIEVVVDKDGGYAQTGYAETAGTQAWQDAAVEGFGYKKAVLENNDNPFRMGGVRMAKTVRKAQDASVASWSADMPQKGEYAVYVSYTSMPNSATDALYRINSLAGTKEFKVNQQMGGGTWIYLGHFPLAQGKQDKPVVELVNVSKDKNAVVTADAVKIGGGMGNVARKVSEKFDSSLDYQYVQSGYPRFTEAARYWMQWAGVPDSIYSPSGNVNDYTDDYKCRGIWVNYLAGGSSMLPKADGLKIPVDLSLAFHTDAGTTMNDSIIGTLAIYYSKNNSDYANGTSRMASRDYTDIVTTNIVEDIRAAFEPKWMRRAMWDKTYFEARTPQVPAMLLELLSHQNFADMKYGLDPTFRFTVSRAIYKGMLEFIARRDNRPFVVQPLPVRAFEIATEGNGAYVLSWKETVDTLEVTATPKYYIVQHRVNDGVFVDMQVVNEPMLKVNIADNDIHSYRIIAGNDGGVSFPSEVLSLCDKGTESVLVVNGFTRISGPDTFDSGEIAGFNDVKDHGVPYINDISFIGSQFEFRRDIPWMDDDAAGFGASRANYETKVIAGNTLDYVYTHGKAIADAGYSFISSSVEAYVASEAKAQVVDLILGKQKEIIVGRGVYGSRFKTFPAELQSKIAEHCQAGGNIFVSGAYVATDLWDNPRATESDREFAANVLGYKWRVGQASVTGEAYEVQSRFPQFGTGRYTFSNELNSDCYAVESPDSFYPADDSKGATIVRYGENNLIAGTAFDNDNYRTVVIGFPFETINGEQSRLSLMKQVLDFFKKNK